MWEARSGSTARSALRRSRKREARSSRFSRPFFDRSTARAGGTNANDARGSRRLLRSHSPSSAHARRLVGASIGAAGVRERRSAQCRSRRSPTCSTSPSTFGSLGTDEGQRRYVRARMRSRPRAPRAPRPPAGPAAGPPRTPTRRKRLPPPTPSSRRSRRRRRAVPVHPRRRRRGAVVALFRRVSRASRRRRRARASRPPPRARRSDWPDSPRPLRHPRPRRARPSRRRRGGGARLLLRGWRPHRLRRSPTRRLVTSRAASAAASSSTPSSPTTASRTVDDASPARPPTTSPAPSARNTSRPITRLARKSPRLSCSAATDSRCLDNADGVNRWVYDPEGCVESVPYESRAAHEDECGYQRVACGLPGTGRGVDCCPTIVLRRERASHRAACPYRLAPCPVPGCGRTVQHNRKAQHVSGCEFRTAECPNGCGWRGRRGR